jgi:hypothetical protein
VPAATLVVTESLRRKGATAPALSTAGIEELRSPSLRPREARRRADRAHAVGRPARRSLGDPRLRGRPGRLEVICVGGRRPNGGDTERFEDFCRQTHPRGERLARPTLTPQSKNSKRLCPTACPIRAQCPTAEPKSPGIMIRVSGFESPPPAWKRLQIRLWNTVSARGMRFRCSSGRLAARPPCRVAESTPLRRKRARANVRSTRSLLVRCGSLLSSRRRRPHPSGTGNVDVPFGSPTGTCGPPRLVRMFSPSMRLPARVRRAQSHGRRPAAEWVRTARRPAGRR